MSIQFNNQMTKSQRLSYLANREQVFGWRRDHRGTNFDVQSPVYAQRAATQLIALGQRNGLLTHAGSEYDVRLVQHALDSQALKGAWKWVNSAEQGTQSVAMPQQVQTQPVEHLVEMDRRHGAHGFRGDPKKEVAADDGSDVLAMAASAKLNGFTGSATAPGSKPSSAKQHEHPDDREAAEVIAIARLVGLAGLRKLEPGHVATNVVSDGSTSGKQHQHPDDKKAAEVIALARAYGLKGFV